MNVMMSNRSRRGPKPALAAFALLALLAIAASVAAGCATTPAPDRQLAAAEAALVDAVGAGAPEMAPGEMHAARAKLDRVKAAMAAKDYRHATWLAEEAEVDAQLARARARSLQARGAADAAQAASRARREEPDRPTPGIPATPAPRSR